MAAVLLRLDGIDAEVVVLLLRRGEPGAGGMEAEVVLGRRSSKDGGGLQGGSYVPARMEATGILWPRRMAAAGIRQPATASDSWRRRRLADGTGRGERSGAGRFVRWVRRLCEEEWRTGLAALASLPRKT